MEKVVFSSWDGKIFDNRQGTEDAVKTELPLGIPSPQKGGEVAAIVSWNGIIVNKPQADVVGLLIAYLQEARKLSCGECSVCSLGIDEALLIIEGIRNGSSSSAELKRLEGIVALVRENAKCSFGRVAALSPLADALEYFEADFTNCAKEGGDKGTLRYQSWVGAPCMQACPAGIDIPGYLELIKNGRFLDSLNLVRERCVLPGVIGRACTNPCESACVRGTLDAPLAIRLLKRYVADAELANGGGILPTNEAKEEKVAIVGAGPAGLAAAFYLRRFGYGVTIFEALPKAGGMAAFGIPDYRLPKDILNYEVDLIKRMGVEIKLNTKIDKLDWQGLQASGYKALYLAVGAHAGTKMGCEGEDTVAPDFVQGVDFLRELVLGKAVKQRGKVAIIGGGNVAMDCARNCLRLGFEEVIVVYRRSETEMPASSTEIKEAKEEGVKFEFLKAPVKIVRKDGKLVGIECISMELGAPDESGRRRPIPIKGSETMFAIDMVIAATGQKPELEFAAKAGLAISDWGLIKVDEQNQVTNIAGVFAGGDCVTGAATLIEALASGRQVALAIDAYLKGEVFSRLPDIDWGDARQQHDKGFVVKIPRQETAHLAIEERSKSYEEVERGLDAAAARAEASRCLRCYRLVVWA